MKNKDIVVVTLKGEFDANRGIPSSEWRFHQDIYLNKNEAKAIVHARSNYATAISTHGKGIPAFHYMVGMAGGNDIKCSKYATYGTRELSKNILKAVGNYVYENLKSNKVLINKPQGGFYLMPEFLNKKFNTSSEMCENILKETGVALLPGSDFGFEKNKMLARLSFTDFDGQNFMNQTQNGKKIDDGLILKLAPKIVEGVDKLKKWSTST